MKKIICLFVLISIVSCKNSKSDSKLLDKPFMVTIDELLMAGEIDTLLHLRLAMYEVLTESKSYKTVESASIYSIIDNLQETCSKKGRIGKIYHQNEDNRLIVIKDLSNSDTLFFKITFENTTSEEINKMTFSLDVYDIMGVYIGKYSLICKGKDCLNDEIIFIEKDELQPRYISVNNLISKVNYFSQKEIFKYSRFDLNKMEIEYQNGKTKEYEF